MTQIAADAYVIPEFDSCISEGGIGGAMYRSGAGEGMEAYGKYIAEHGKTKLKDVVVTESGGGKSKYLIHAVTVGADRENAFEVARDSVYNSLKAAQGKGLKSVAIPAIGTGIIGTLTNSQSADAILSGVKKFADEGGSMDVCAVVYSTGAGYNDFSNALKTSSYVTAKATAGKKEFNTRSFVSELFHTITTAPRKKFASDSLFKKETLEKLLALKDSSGKAMTMKEIETLYKNCQISLKDRKPIPNYEERIMAVLNNPKEVDIITGFDNNLPYAIWIRIQEPLDSTIKANPDIF